MVAVHLNLRACGGEARARFYQMDEIPIRNWDDLLRDRELWKTQFEVLKSVVQDHRASYVIWEEYKERLKKQTEESHER